VSASTGNIADPLAPDLKSPLTPPPSRYVGRRNLQEKDLAEGKAKQAKKRIIHAEEDAKPMALID
jgi:hypothetical protein